MTQEQAKRVMAVLLAGAIPRDTDPETLRFWQAHLLPLPFAFVLRRAEVGATRSRWVNSLPELLDACGVGEEARADLVRARNEGGRLERDLRSRTGWSYVAPGAPVPPGVLEAEAVAREAVAPPPPPRPALPASKPAFLRERDGRLAAVVGQKRVPPVRDAPTPSREQIEAELAAADARFKAMTS